MAERGRGGGRGKRCDRKCIFSAQAINLLECSWPDILLEPLIDGRGAKRKWFPHVVSCERKNEKLVIVKQFLKEGGVCRWETEDDD